MVNYLWSRSYHWWSNQDTKLPILDIIPRIGDVITRFSGIVCVVS